MEFFELPLKELKQGQFADIFQRNPEIVAREAFNVLKDRYDAVSTDWIGVIGRDVFGTGNIALGLLSGRLEENATDWIGSIGMHTEGMAIEAIHLLSLRKDMNSSGWIGNIGIYVDGAGFASIDALWNRNDENAIYWRKEIKGRLIRLSGNTPLSAFLS